MEIDERDQKIIRHVIRHPDATNEQIAAETGIPLSTLNKRMGQLLSTEGCLERSLRVRDWKAAGFPVQVRIDIIAHQRNLAKGEGGPVSATPIPDSDEPTPPAPLASGTIRTQKQLARYIKERLPLHAPFVGRIVVEKAIILLGQQADISLTVHAESYDVVLNFVTNGLRILNGVQTTWTSQEAWVI